MSPQGQMTSPRGIVGGMGMMQQGGMANQQANNMYQVTHNFFYGGWGGGMVGINNFVKYH